jgi:DNA-binding MarR family transcriptional regulator
MTQQLQEQLAVFSNLRPAAMYMHHFQAFLFIADHQPCRYVDVEQHLKISNPSVSRLVDSLQKGSYRVESLDLVETFSDPAEGRRLLVRLTKKGQLLHQQLCTIGERSNSIQQLHGIKQ